MNDPAADVKRQEGYKQYQQAAAEVPPSKYPWGTMLGTLGGVAAAHGVGYLSAGMLAKLLAESRFGARFMSMSPDARMRVLGQAVAGAGSVAAVTAGLAHLAGQMRNAQEISRLQAEKEKASGTKVASVYDVYIRAMQGFPSE